ncbi:MAG: GNAT family N-acetyltransferase [Terracidiphilus sp.]|nr:GNAT family N-acetyltransferase [Terracidiphilus sp.]
MGITIRKAKKADVPQILSFIRGLAEYERLSDAVVITEADLERDGFGPHPYFECLIAEQDTVPAGFALYFFNYSTFAGRPGIYLEDLFVCPELRGRGIGKALLSRVAAVAVENGCARFEWSVLDWNQPAIDFYSSVGGQFMDEWRLVRVTGNALEQLAAASADREGGL